MTDTATPQNVVQAIAAVMADLPAIGKEGRNKDQGYSFRGIEHITAAAQKLCAKHQVVFVPLVTEWAEKDLTINNKPWTDQRLMVTYRVYGPGGRDDFIEAHTVGIGRDNSDKGTNKALAQAFKYALLQVLCIADPKDDADLATHVTDSPAPQPEVRFATTAQIKALVKQAEGVEENGNPVLWSRPADEEGDGPFVRLYDRVLVEVVEGNKQVAITASDADALAARLTQPSEGLTEQVAALPVYADTEPF